MEKEQNPDMGLLWKAFPLGYLPRRGIETVGGYLCVDAEEGPPLEGNSGWFRLRMGKDGAPNSDDVRGVLDGFPDAVVNSGALLPIVSPENAGNWAILLLELTRLAHMSIQVGDAITFLRKPRPHVRGWELQSRWHADELGIIVNFSHHWDVDAEEDPAIAYLKVVAMLRVMYQVEQEVEKKS